LVIQQHERDLMQKELIQQAKKEEQLAKEKLERKKRMGEQMEKFAPLQNKIKVSMKVLIDLWSSVEDKKLLSPNIFESVPNLLKRCQEVMNEARNKVIEGDCGDDFIQKITALDTELISKSKEIEEDNRRILNERKKIEEEKANALKLKEEEAKKAAEQLAVQNQTQQQLQQQSQPSPQQVPSQIPASNPQTDSKAVSSPEAICHVDSKAWYDSIVKFKSDFIKDVVFTDQEKQFKFDLQRAVNTPLNSLSGVSSAHLQDKVDKLVLLLSGGQVPVGERTVSVNQHKHARSFCLGLAAKKLAKQGEDVVSSDHKSAFPAATFALAIWDKFPEFGKLLLAYMFEMCPFLVPYHPGQTAGQNDRDYYVLLGYKYDGDVIEKQDKYLKRMSGLARLYAALSVSHLPKTSSGTIHPHPLSRIWTWLASVLNLTPHTDITASIMLDIMEVTGSAMFARYSKQFSKLLELIKTQYFSKLEAVKSEGGPTVRLEQFLGTAIRAGNIRKPDGVLRHGFL